MLNEDRINLSKARLALAKERIAFARQILELGDYKTVANRSYYAVFSAMRAVLALDAVDSKKHSGVISEFRRRYLKTEILPKELSPIIRDLEMVRQGSDYDDFYIVSRAQVTEQLEDADTFVKAVETYLNTQYTKSAP